MLVKNDLAARYISLLKKSLVGDLYIENEYQFINTISLLLRNSRFSFPDIFNVNRDSDMYHLLKKQKHDGNTLTLVQRNADGSTEPAYRMRNFTELAHTMIGTKRMDNIQQCIETVLEEDVAGDFIETGVWRGGATIFMRGVLAAYGIHDRIVWVADSFQGVPSPTYPQDAGFDISKQVFPFLAVSKDEVAELFNRYELLDQQVKFLVGWFKDTLPTAPIKSIAVLRLDGDLYESTMDALNPLYAKVTTGGFIIVDDYYSCPPCKRAIDDFRIAQGIADDIIQIDDQSIFWRKR